MESWEQQGVSRVRMNGLTVYLTHRLSVAPLNGDYARACAFLAEHDDTAYLVHTRFNANSMAAWVREQETQGNDPIAFLADHVKVERIYELRTLEAD